MKLGINTVSSWFGLLMIVLVFAGVIAFGFTNFMDEKVFGTRRTVFVCILLAYGIYRTVRFYQVFKKAQDED
jgi:hypothetical protein